jgi:hypothetical protein
MNDPQEQKPIILSLIPSGNPDFPRYMISDQYLRYWGNEGWTEQKDIDNAIVYASSGLALEQMQQLLMTEHVGQPAHRYVAPIIIDLYSDEKVSLRDLQAWLTKVSKLLIDSPEHGNGPVSGSLGLCRIDWGQLREVNHG